MNEGDTIGDQAARWHIASIHDDMDWDGFTAWLEADPRHAAAYDQIALTDAALSEAGLPDAPRHALADNDHEPFAAPSRPIAGLGSQRWGGRRWAGGAIAACLIAMAGLPLLHADPATRYHTQSERLEIALDDGSRIILAPASVLTIAGDEQQEIALEGGAWFDIRHDPDRLLKVTAGPFTISDIGTQFDIQMQAGDVRVAVAGGKVAVSSAALAQDLELVAGRQLQFDTALRRSVTSAIPAAAVGQWREGRLTYDGAPLSLVSADLSRYAGTVLTVPAELRGRQFSGTLAIGNGDAAIHDLAQLMGLEIVPDAGGYVLRAGGQ